MRDIGFDFYTSDPHCQNLLARGFEYYPERNTIFAITALEYFEHFEDPLKDIGKMLTISRNIFFSTELLPEPIPSPDKWKYYAFEHGQHISFYSQETLNYIAKKFNLYIYFGKYIHFLSEKRISPQFFSILEYLPYLGIDKIFKMGLKTKTQSDMENRINAFHKTK